MSTLFNIKDRTSHYPQLIKTSNDSSCLAFQITADYITSSAGAVCSQTIRQHKWNNNTIQPVPKTTLTPIKETNSKLRQRKSLLRKPLKVKFGKLVSTERRAFLSLRVKYERGQGRGLSTVVRWPQGALVHRLGGYARGIWKKLR